MNTKVLVAEKHLKIAVAGNPNCGKSTLINLIAGSRLHVGNWPGVTVEKKEANLKLENGNVRLIDLPGTYSLSPYSQEEIIARDFLINENPDLIINVIDSTNLERNLYLTIQLLELGIPMVIALNMYDEAENKGYKIDIQKIESILGVKVIPTIATQSNGGNKLLSEINDLIVSEKINKPIQQKFSTDLEEMIEKLSQYLEDCEAKCNVYNKRWLSIKLIENDEIISDSYSNPEIKEKLDILSKHILEAHDDDLESLIADERYGLAAGLTKEVLQKPNIKKEEITDKIDKIVLHKYLGIPVFFIAMWFVFKMTFDIANPFVDWIDEITAGPIHKWFSVWLTSSGFPEWTVSLVTDGIIAGVGFVLVFVPVIFAMMFFITFLEGSGYMARAAFVMDRSMHSIGLHGKSFIPLLLGFGCNVPSIYATRTLENERDKILTSLLVPFMSCGARLPVYVVFIAVFFKESSGTILWSLYILGIAVAVVCGFIFKKTLFKGESQMFIMELPPYRMPTAKSLAIHTWEKGKHFLVKAGTYILAVSVFVWFMLNLPWGVENKKDSILGMAGQVTAPIFAPMGFGNWEASSALITGLIAKEIVVGTMAEIYIDETTQNDETPINFSEDLKAITGGFFDAIIQAGSNVVSTFGVATITAEDESDVSLKKVIESKFSPLSAFTFMVFVLLYMPCIITGVAMKQEFNTWKWYGVSLINGFVVAWLLSTIIYQLGSLFI